jgi:hypothetical protein
MSELPPLGAMTSADLNECLERVVWLLERKNLMPADLAWKLDTWRVDLQAEIEDRRLRCPIQARAAGPFGCFSLGERVETVEQVLLGVERPDPGSGGPGLFDVSR